MKKEFQTTTKRRNTRERFYSSMNYEEYYEIFGPPAPIVKPMDDPTEDMPPLDLEEDFTLDEKKDLKELQDEPLLGIKMDTILQIEGSQSFTQNLQKSPRGDTFNENTKKRPALFPLREQDSDEDQTPKRMRVRMRSRSDSSEYLIFNFLEKFSQNGRKKLKLE